MVRDLSSTLPASKKILCKLGLMIDMAMSRSRIDLLYHPAKRIEKAPLKFTKRPGNCDRNTKLETPVFLFFVRIETVKSAG